MAFDPIPVPVRGSATFNTDAEQFALGMAQFAVDYNELSSVLDAALRSSSTTSLTVGTGSRSLTVQTGLGFIAGYPIRIASTATPTTYMDGVVTSYNSGTGALVVNATSSSGSGTLASWNVMVLPAGGNYAGLTDNKFTGLQTFANSVTIAVAATLDFTGADSNNVQISGVGTVTAITLPIGAVVFGRITASGSAVTFSTASGLSVAGGDWTAVIGDYFIVTRPISTVTMVIPFRISGRLPDNQYLNATTDATFSSTSSNNVATPEWVNGRVAQYVSSLLFSATSNALTSTFLQNIAHGLGRVPIVESTTLVFQSAQAGWSIGDEIPRFAAVVGASENLVFVGTDATNIILVNRVSNIAVPNKTTGVITTVAATEFRIRVYYR